MVSFLKKVLFVLITGGLLLVAYRSAHDLERILLNTNSIFITFGISLILTFSTIIIIRYLFLMFFSIIQTIHQSVYETHILRTIDSSFIIVSFYN